MLEPRTSRTCLTNQMRHHGQRRGNGYFQIPSPIMRIAWPSTKGERRILKRSGLYFGKDHLKHPIGQLRSITIRQWIYELGLQEQLHWHAYSVCTIE